MSLQAHTDSSAAAPVNERVALPELSSRLHHELVKVASRYAVPIDELAEYILEQPGRTLRDLRDGVAAKRQAAYDAAAVIENAQRRCVCRHGGACQRPFNWRGIARCGCGPIRGTLQ